MQKIRKPSPGEKYAPLPPAQLDNLHLFYEQARKPEPIFFSPAFNAYVVTRMEDVRAILANADASSSSNLMCPIESLYPQIFQALSQGYASAPAIINADSDRHERQHAPWARLSSAARVRSMEVAIWDTANTLVDAFIHDSHADLISQFAQLLIRDVICDVYGIVPPDRAIVMSGCESALEAISTADEQAQAEATSHMAALYKLLANYIVHRRAAPQDDFISEIIAALAPGEDPLPIALEGELVQYLSGLLLATHAGTVNLIGDGVRLLLSDPDQWNALCQQPELIPHAVEAIKSRDDVDFGSGKHICAGIPPGQREVEIALEVLTQRLPHMRLVSSERRQTPISCGLKRLEVAW